MLGAYKRQSLSGGRTRVETLVQLYDRGISCIYGCKLAEEANDPQAYTNSLLTLHKVILALHSGLKPEEDDVAFNVARILHYVIGLTQDKNWEAAVEMLTQLRNAFSEVTDEANQLERDGVIPPMPLADSYESLA